MDGDGLSARQHQRGATGVERIGHEDEERRDGFPIIVKFVRVLQKYGTVDLPLRLAS